QPRDWVTRTPLRDLFLSTVLPIVVGVGVRSQAVGLTLQQRWPAAGSRALHRRARSGIDREDVVAIHNHAGHAIACGLGRHILDWHLAALMNRDRILVIF